MADIITVGTERPVCPQCLFRYEVVTGRVAAGPGLQGSGGASPVPYAQAPALQLATGADPAAVTVRVPLKGVNLQMPGGDLACVVQVAEDAGPGEVVAVYNLTTGQHFALAAPGDKAAGTALLGGTAVTLTAFLVLGLIGLPWPLVAVLAVLVGAGIFLWIRDRDGPRARLSAAARGALHHKRGLLERKEELQRTIHALQQEREKKTALQARLQRLAAKMEEVGADLYGTRLAVVEAGLGTVEQQLALDDRLVAGYAKTIKIIEIELEASASADDIPEDLAGVLAARQAELEALEAEHRKLKDQLAANDEVEKLLRSG
jgi:hypothetical protein